MDPENSRRSFPKIEEMTKEQIRRTIVKKRETSALAQRIVESLLEPGVIEAVFLSSLPHINQCHMEDVIEERTIIHLCGYPICSNRLVDKDIPKQQYRISVRNNKVYDITMRKNFCSNKCFKAANFIKAQMLKSPLWFREYETIPNFHLMPDNIKTNMGEEVDLSIIEKIQHDKPRFTSTGDFANISMSDINDKIELNLEKSGESSMCRIDGNIADTCDDMECKDKSDTKVWEHNKSKNVFQTELFNKTYQSNNYDSNAGTMPAELEENIMDCKKNHVKECGVSIHKTTYKKCGTVPFDEIPEITKPNTKETPKLKRHSINIIGEVVERPEKRIDPMITSMTGKSTKSKCKIELNHTSMKEDPTPNLIMYVEKCVAEWLTLDSMIFLFGKMKIQEIVVDKGECFKRYINNMSNGLLYSATSYDQYQQICRKLNMLELEDHRYDNKIVEREMKPLPDYSVLKEESKKIELKVRSFLSGKLEVPEPTPPAKQESEGNDGNLTQLALIDKNAQNALRRKILLTNLNKILNDVQISLGLQGVSIASDVRLLVNSFKLSPNNIMFKPIQWPLIGMIVIKLLSLRDLEIHRLLQTECASSKMQLMLLSYKQDGGYLDRLVWWLTDIDRLLNTNNTELSQM